MSSRDENFRMIKRYYENNNVKASSKKSPFVIREDGFIYQGKRKVCRSFSQNNYLLIWNSRFNEIDKIFSVYNKLLNLQRAAEKDFEDYVETNDIQQYVVVEETGYRIYQKNINQYRSCNHRGENSEILEEVKKDRLARYALKDTFFSGSFCSGSLCQSPIFLTDEKLQVKVKRTHTLQNRIRKVFSILSNVISEICKSYFPTGALVPQSWTIKTEENTFLISSNNSGYEWQIQTPTVVNLPKQNYLKSIRGRDNSLLTWF